jgi:alkylhydroperoxidase family enzyme
MNHWSTIAGWFSPDDARVYQRIAAAVPDGARIVEVGVWMGRSMGALGHYLSGYAKSGHLIAVDTFQGTQSEPCLSAHRETVEALGGSVRKVFEANMLALGLSPEVFEMTSEKAAARTAHASLDAVFLDACHDREAVRADIDAWLPKVKAGGFIGGHDFNLAEVRAAVFSRFTAVEVFASSWLATIE